MAALEILHLLADANFLFAFSADAIWGFGYLTTLEFHFHTPNLIREGIEAWF